MATLEKLPDNSILSYCDESGFDEFYDREYGYALRGREVQGEVSGTHHARTNVAAAQKMGTNGTYTIIAMMTYICTMNSALFEYWLEHVFVPSVPVWERGKLWLIMDNARFHSKARVKEIAEKYGFNILFLPKYSPDFNPIEHLWANAKKRLRQHMRKFDNFWQSLSFAFQGI